MYPWIKSLHLLFVMAWVACVFYLPRILVNMAEAREQPAVLERLQLMGKRLYRFGHIMFGLAFTFGLWLWFGFQFGFNISGGWLYTKLVLVALVLVYFVVCGRMLKQGTAALPSSRMLRLLNELPILVVLAIIYL
ncbi:MAG TPA: CopD family protein, partial [Candidatus Acidoferrum sp.]|nr:CopD family protein [Candidatus Acidoferrum sp.]